jgi:hypothetical protein
VKNDYSRLHYISVKETVENNMLKLLFRESNINIFITNSFILNVIAPVVFGIMKLTNQFHVASLGYSLL